MLREGADFAAAALRLLRHPQRYEIFRRLTNDLKWSGEQNRIPAEYLTRLFPEVKKGSPLHLGDVSHPFELPYAERYALSAIASAMEARSIFEFGTFTGTSTRLLADSAPGARVLTLDLPDEEMVWEAWIGEVVGLAFREAPEYAGRIFQHRKNSRSFDYSGLGGSFDLVFVDASHELPDVLHDSRRALELVAPAGVMVWDDYQPGLEGVVGALNQLHAEGVPLARIAHTRLVVHRPRGFPVALPPRNPQPWTSAPDHGRPDRIQGPESTPR
jgi:hypothetical protein